MTQALTDEEKFRFDLEGYLIIKNVLSRDTCAELSALSDEAWPRQPEDGAFRRAAAVTQWGKPFMDLMDHPKILPYLVELIGGRLRIDHDYSIYTRKGAPSSRIHGGPRILEPDHWYYYNDGVMRNGLMVASLGPINCSSVSPSINSRVRNRASRRYAMS